MSTTERIDKFLWAVRLYKTRNSAAEACKDNKIFVNGAAAKPSRNIELSDIVRIKDGALYREYKVLQILSNRVGAKLVPDYIQDMTPPEVLAEFEILHAHLKLQRDRGTGRPTKKERRDLEDFID